MTDAQPGRADERPRLWAGFPVSRTKGYGCLPLRMAEAHLSPFVWRFWTQRVTPAGRWLIASLGISLVVAQSSLDVQFYVPFMYLFGLWCAAVVGTWFVRPSMAVRTRHARRIGVGRMLTVDIQVTQRRRGAFIPVGIIPYGLPWALEPWPREGVTIPPLGKDEAATVRLSIRCLRRGVYHWRGFRLETDYPFGLLRAYRNAPEQHRLLVHPDFTPLARLSAPVGTRYQPGGVALASHIGNAFEYVGNREYRDGDSVRGIDWRATARLQRPIVREYREEYFLRVGVILDTHVPRRAAADDAANFERAVSVCAAVADKLARSDTIVDLFAAGPNLYHLTAGRSLAYLEQILDILAAVEATPHEPFATLEPEVVATLAKITTVVCILLDWDEPRRTFVERLRREGAGVKVVCVRDRPCTLDPAAAGGADFVRIGRAAFEAGVQEV